MKRIRFLVVISLLCYFCILTVKGQTITTSSDSTVVTTTKTTPDSLSRGLLGTLKSWDKPSRAALYSTIIPGAGQFYNKSYWKIPIIYAGGITIGFFFNKWHKNYLLFRSSLAVATDGDSTTVDVFAARFTNDKGVTDEDRHLQYLSRGVENYRRYRDYNIIFGLLLLGLNVSEAYVDAHLKGFDISDELSFKVEPSIIQGPGFQYAPGVAFKFNLNN
ncbi:DUF5683 domain-containing protein [Adhaeribacter pallidiroseus]|uniref:DUF5683 domain-containing protein n=1 Tax=Adhaeribacter pallidiroseus TaxID=2072847 RepID=A0A369QJQ5_9BACT|nr:DUF5683 domain-containing protein [Adhaeribacter pallidiroseus]RDC63477.1 hypothetical protein AHMF7616_02081 [Adhaeribacter pallidiroseus]